MKYLQNGNIDQKYDAGTYAYDGSKINAVVGIETTSSQISLMTQDVTYNSLQAPEMITEGDFELSFTYGLGDQRVTSELKENGNIKYKCVYLGDMERTTDQAGNTTDVHYINTPSGLTAMAVKTASNTDYYYPYQDQLGSIIALTDASGSVIYEQSYDAWGRERNPIDWTYTLNPPNTKPTWLYRGYTGHEELTEFSLIHMNGRLYDPIVGRMLSPDNFVQDGTSTQDYNRYSYVNNNPLKYTDPSGEQRVGGGGAYNGSSSSGYTSNPMGGTRYFVDGIEFSSSVASAYTGGGGAGVSGIAVYGTVAKTAFVVEQGIFNSGSVGPTGQGMRIGSEDSFEDNLRAQGFDVTPTFDVIGKNISMLRLMAHVDRHANAYGGRYSNNVYDETAIPYFVNQPAYMFADGIGTSAWYQGKGGIYPSNDRGGFVHVTFQGKTAPAHMGGTSWSAEATVFQDGKRFYKTKFETPRSQYFGVPFWSPVMDTYLKLPSSGKVDITITFRYGYRNSGVTGIPMPSQSSITKSIPFRQ